MARPRLSPQDHLFAKIRDGTLFFLRMILTTLDTWQAYCLRTAQGYFIPGDPPEPSATDNHETPSQRGLGLKASYYDIASDQPTASPAGLVFEIIESLRRKLVPADLPLHNRLMIWLASLRANLLKTCEAVHKRHGHALAVLYIAFILLALSVPCTLLWVREALHQMLIFSAALIVTIIVTIAAGVFCRRENKTEAEFLMAALEQGMEKMEHSLDRLKSQLRTESQGTGHALATVRDRLSRQASIGQYRTEITLLIHRTESLQQRLADTGDLTALYVRIAGMIQNSLEAETEDKRLNWRPGKGLLAFRNVPKIVWRLRDIAGFGALGIAASWFVATQFATDPLSLFAAVTTIGLGTVAAVTAVLNLQDSAGFPLSPEDLQRIGREKAFQRFQADINETASMTDAFMMILNRLLEEETRPR